MKSANYVIKNQNDEFFAGWYNGFTSGTPRWVKVSEQSRIDGLHGAIAIALLTEETASDVIQKMWEINQPVTAIPLW